MTLCETGKIWTRTHIYTYTHIYIYTNMWLIWYFQTYWDIPTLKLPNCIVSITYWNKTLNIFVEIKKFLNIIIRIFCTEWRLYDYQKHWIIIFQQYKRKEIFWLTRSNVPGSWSITAMTWILNVIEQSTVADGSSV